LRADGAGFGQGGIDRLLGLFESDMHGLAPLLMDLVRLL
jgi:hypothetical protein